MPDSAEQSFESANDEFQRHQGYETYRENILRKVMKQDNAASMTGASPTTNATGLMVPQSIADFVATLVGFCFDDF